MYLYLVTLICLLLFWIVTKTNLFHGILFSDERGCLCNGFEKHVAEDNGLFTNRLVVVGLPARTCVVFSA